MGSGVLAGVRRGPHRKGLDTPALVRAMARRRPTFPAYARRRWRFLGLVLVLLSGSLLVLAITDRGHDPLWTARGAGIEAVDVAPDGSVVYTLVSEEANISRLEARSGRDGDLLWESPFNATRALLRAGPDGVAVATDFPLAFLTVFRDDGSVSFQVPLEGNPRAMAIEGRRLALALQAPGNPVLVFEDGRLNRTHVLDSFVNTLDLRAGRLAVGTGAGQVKLFADNGTELFNASLPAAVRSLRLSGDGATLAAGGFSLAPGNLGGHVAFFDATRADPLVWTAETAVGIGLVDLDRAGVEIMAVEESPPSSTVLLFDTATGVRRFAYRVDGNIARDDAGAFGGAALSPDGRTLVVATLRGGVDAYTVPDGEPRWSYGSQGSSILVFAAAENDLLVANGRLVKTGGLDTLFLFSTEREPLLGSATLLAVGLVGLALAVGVLVLSVGYWRVRRSY